MRLPSRPARGPAKTPAASLRHFAVVAVALFGLSSSSGAHADEHLSISIFGDVGATAESGAKGVPTYLLSGLDFFVRADLTPRIGFVGELFFGGLLRSGEVIDQEASTVGDIDLPRLYARFTLGPWLEIRLGRDFTPVGYYQTAYPNTGLVFQLATERPHMFTVYAGGASTIQELGLFLHGAVDIGKALTLRYALSTGNGSLNAGRDETRWKSVTGRLVLQPRAIPGLELGGSVLYDKLAFLVLDTLPVELGVTAYSAHLVYVRHPVEFIAEFLRMQLDEVLPGLGDLSMTGAFAQLGWEFGRFTPYARFEILRSQVPAITGPEVAARFAPVTEVLGGVRVRLHEKFVLKAQYGHDFERGLHRGSFQAAFAY